MSNPDSNGRISGAFTSPYVGNIRPVAVWMYSWVVHPRLIAAKASQSFTIICVKKCFRTSSNLHRCLYSISVCPRKSVRDLHGQVRVTEWLRTFLTNIVLSWITQFFLVVAGASVDPWTVLASFAPAVADWHTHLTLSQCVAMGLFFTTAWEYTSVSVRLG